MTLEVAMSDTDVAIAAAEAGVAVLRRMYGADLQHLSKSPTDFATGRSGGRGGDRRVIVAGRSDDAFKGCVVTDLTGGALHSGRGMIAAADGRRMLACSTWSGLSDHSTRRG